MQHEMRDAGMTGAIDETETEESLPLESDRYDEYVCESLEQQAFETNEYAQPVQIAAEARWCAAQEEEEREEEA